MNKFLWIFNSLLVLYSCNGNGDLADSYGNFEATEILVSSEATGKLLQVGFENGQTLKAGEKVALVDTFSLYLKGKQLKSMRKEILANTSDVLSQINVLEEQKNVLIIEQKRVQNLIADSAASTKQLDDIIGKIKVIDRQIEGVRIKNQAVLSKLDALNVQIEEVEYELGKCRIVNPIDGVVLQKFVENQELVMKGKVLYKIANLDKLELKSYIDGTQLPGIRLGQKVKVFVDKDKKENTEFEGTVSWISSNAEFTPKIIQTKEERVKLVYAIKVLVKNDGTLKIGMPGEVKF
ncbi:MAG: HlyD family efflux transporter periplasmic adaptor subunit [Bacteroidales bacterium]